MDILLLMLLGTAVLLVLALFILVVASSKGDSHMEKNNVSGDIKKIKSQIDGEDDVYF
jgi:cell division septal protein FtsQ